MIATALGPSGHGDHLTDQGGTDLPARVRTHQRRAFFAALPARAFGFALAAGAPRRFACFAAAALRPAAAAAPPATPRVLPPAADPAAAELDAPPAEAPPFDDDPAFC
jgi:hypothetical protein